MVLQNIELHELETLMYENEKNHFSIVFDTIFQYAVKFVLFIVAKPLLYLYLRGPSCGNWCMWAGTSYVDICAYITGVPSDHWKKNEILCKKLIITRFQSFLVPLYTLVYLFLLLLLLFTTWKLLKNISLKIINILY